MANTTLLKSTPDSRLNTRSPKKSLSKWQMFLYVSGFKPTGSWMAAFCVCFWVSSVHRQVWSSRLGGSYSVKSLKKRGKVGVKEKVVGIVEERVEVMLSV